MLKDDTLAGLACLITGGGSGLGYSMAERFHSLGARLALVGRNGDRLADAAARLAGSDRVTTHTADVREPAAVEAAVAAATAAHGGLDIVVNNAAGNFLAPTEDLSPNAFDAVVRTVLHGTFHVTQAVGRRWIAGGHPGSILNILATYAWTGSAFVVPSAVAKAGVLAMTRSLAVEWAVYGIRVNAIAPGPFPTEGAWKRLLPTPELEQASRARIPAGRFGERSELAELAAFLVSGAAPYITGECVTIDGGGWLSGGGLFNDLTRIPRADLKKQLEALKPKK